MIKVVSQSSIRESSRFFYLKIDSRLHSTSFKNISKNSKKSFNSKMNTFFYFSFLIFTVKISLDIYRCKRFLSEGQKGKVNAFLLKGKICRDFG